MICPVPLAEALELEKGESLEWIIQDRHTFAIRRSRSSRRAERSSHE
jgi:hypothetical protein